MMSLETIISEGGVNLEIKQLRGEGVIREKEIEREDPLPLAHLVVDPPVESKI